MINQFAGGPSISEKEPSFDPLSSIGEEDTPKITVTPVQDLYGSTYNGIKLSESDVIEGGGGNDSEEGKIIDEIDKELNLNENVLEKNSENPVTPLLKRINDINGVHIGDEDLQKIFDNIGDISNNDDVVSSLIDALDKSGIEENTKKVLSTILLQIGKNNDDRLNENKDKEFALPEEFKGNKLLEDDKYKDIVNLLAKNYISFPDNDNGEPDFEKDLQLSIETTVNKIIDGKQIPKTQGLKEAISDIKSGDLETRLDALKYVYILANTNEGKEGKSSKLLYKKIKQKENLQKESLQERFNELKEKSKIAIKEKNIEELKKIEVDLIDVKEEADKEGDIFIVSDLDKISAEIDSVLKETT